MCIPPNLYTGPDVLTVIHGVRLRLSVPFLIPLIILILIVPFTPLRYLRLLLFMIRPSVPADVTLLRYLVIFRKIFLSRAYPKLVPNPTPDLCHS